MEIGDRFIIDWKGIKSTYPSVIQCKYKDRIYIITGLSKSKKSVYFEDKKTNKSCRCDLCSSSSSIKSTAIRDIKVIETKVQYDRNKKLIKLLKNERQPF